MKTSSASIDRHTARNCFFLNQLATPGMGSLMAKRTVSGIGQLTLAIAGFLLVLAWFALTLKEAYNLPFETGPAKSYAWVGVTGGAIFVASWLWALATSISVWRSSTGDSPPVTNPPPKI